MKCLDVFILVFYALDNIYDNQPNEVLGDFLSSMNPFLFKGEGSSVPDVYEKFKKSFNGKFVKECSETEGYYFAKDDIARVNTSLRVLLRRICVPYGHNLPFKSVCIPSGAINLY